MLLKKHVNYRVCKVCYRRTDVPKTDGLLCTASEPRPLMLTRHDLSSMEVLKVCASSMGDFIVVGDVV